MRLLTTDAWPSRAHDVRCGQRRQRRRRDRPADPNTSLTSAERYFDSVRAMLASALAGLALTLPAVASPVSGISGVVLRGPITPVCRAELPCSAPAGHVLVKVWRGDRIVSSALTDSHGRFRFVLRPSAYIVTVRSPRGPALRTYSQRAEVVVGRMTRVRITLDTGIR